MMNENSLECVYWRNAVNDWIRIAAYWDGRMTETANNGNRERYDNAMRQYDFAVRRIAACIARCAKHERAQFNAHFAPHGD